MTISQGIVYEIKISIQSHFSVCFCFRSLKGLDPWCCRKYPWMQSVAGNSLDIMCCHGAKDIPLTYKIHVDMYVHLHMLCNSR